MKQDQQNKSIYENLAMQAALRLYLPHGDTGRCIPLTDSVSLDRPEAEPICLRLGNFKELFKKGKKK